MIKDFKLRLTLLLTELDIKPLGNREAELFTELAPSSMFIGYNMSDIVASIVFYTQRELGNYVSMLEICKEIGANKTTVFRLVGKITRHYGTSYIISNPSVVSRVEAIINQMDINKKLHDVYFNLLLEGFNKYELVANDHGLHKGRGYYAAVAYILLNPRGYTQNKVCSYINCTPLSLRSSLKQIKKLTEA